MSLHTHRAPRTDLLADGLGELLARVPADPFAQELVLVPAKGVERWLSQRLSHLLGTGGGGRADGICAGVEFRNPRSLIAEITGTAAEDPWAPDALAWPLLETLDDSLDELWAATLAQHLGHTESGDEADLRRGRRYAVARRLAGLFASYAAQRPRLLADWSAGESTDGVGGQLASDLSWQPPLWRALTSRVEAPTPYERHRAAVARLQESVAESTGLPERLSLFGHTRLTATDLELLGALSTHHDLHLWLPHPSDVQWRALAGRFAGERDGSADNSRGPISRRRDTSHRQVGHPLLATLGRDLRELQRGLSTLDAIDHHLDDDKTPDTLLGWLQGDLRADGMRPQGRVLNADDRSVQVHSCHGSARQVDVLREVLLGLLQDSDLQPRDIVVLCPDIEAFAPLINAGFGLGEVVQGGHPAHRLRVRLADRSLTQTNPLLGVADALLDLANSRAAASQVLDLAQLGSVRRRFGFDDDSLEAVTDWVRQSGVRWGFDQPHRAPYGLDGFVHSTWQFGIDRVLAGVAMSDDSHAWLGTTLALDDVGSNRVEVVGRLSEFVDRTRSACDRLTGTRPLADWIQALEEGVGALTSVDRDDAWQIGQLHRELSQVLADAGDRASLPMRLPDVRALLAGHLAGRPTRANFRTGSLTVATLVPMRSVPHRVVCLVGLDDGIFPRQTLVDGDDVLARDPQTGERNQRSEDRQLLLDAIGSATETLVITYTGDNEHTGQQGPPSVPLGELLDALDATTENAARDQIVVRHPLQPFDVRNVTPGALGVPTPFTFDATALPAAKNSVGSRPEQGSFVKHPLPPRETTDVSLADLVGFFKHPIKGFFRALDVTLPWEVDAISDAMPVEIDNLEMWSVGDRMLADMLRMIHPEQALGLEWRRGTLPPGQLGWRAAGKIRDQAMALATAALTHRQVAATSHDVDVDLGGGRRLTGTIGPVYGDRLVTVGYSRVDGKHLLEAWVRLLALAAGRPDHNWTALVVGRPPRGNGAVQRLIGPPEGAPEALLRDLVSIYDAGRLEPLPLPLKASYAWASARRLGDEPVPMADAKWKSARFPGENADPAVVRVWGEHAPLSVLLGAPRVDEMVEGESTRLGAWSARLWGPLLASERGVL